MKICMDHMHSRLPVPDTGGCLACAIDHLTARAEQAEAKLADAESEIEAYHAGAQRLNGQLAKLQAERDALRAKLDERGWVVDRAEKFAEESDALRAEVKRLRVLVEEAYREGMYDHPSADEYNIHEGTLRDGWLASESRAEMGDEP